MFTGIVEGTGQVVAVRAVSEGGSRLVVQAGWLSGAGGARPGDSISVDGACLTVVALEGSNTLAFDLSPETLGRTTLGTRHPGEAVNLERALRLSDRLGGHLVLGHVDGIGEVQWVREVPGGREMAVRAPQALLPYLAEKGSVAVDGVSLTVAGLEPEGFRVALVPFTLEHTTLGRARAGRRVHIEVDVVARYVHRLLAAAGHGGGSGVTEAFLEAQGFTLHSFTGGFDAT